MRYRNNAILAIKETQIALAAKNLSLKFSRYALRIFGIFGFVKD